MNNRLASLSVLSALALGACASPPPAQSFAPLNYSYLRPITFKVSSLNVVNNYTPGADETQLNSDNPAAPGPTLLAMLNSRMQPSGQPGTGTITVQAASITEGGGNLNGQMTVDINLTSADGRSTGFAEASVSASAAEPDGDPGSPAVQAALYQMTKKLMDAINVQLPYQIVHNIPTWVDWTNPQGGGVLPGVASGSIQSAPLTAPLTALPGTTVNTTTTVTPAPAVPSAGPPGVGNLVPPGFLAPPAQTPPQ